MTNHDKYAAIGMLIARELDLTPDEIAAACGFDLAAFAAEWNAATLEWDDLVEAGKRFAARQRSLLSATTPAA